MRLDSFLSQVALMSLAGLGVATEQRELDGRDFNINQPQLEARVFTAPPRLGMRFSPGLPIIINRDFEEVDLETRGLFKDTMKKCQKNPKICEAMRQIVKPGKRDVEEPELQTRKSTMGASGRKRLGSTRQRMCKLFPSACRFPKPKGKRHVEEPQLETRKAPFKSNFKDMVRYSRERARRTKKALKTPSRRSLDYESVPTSRLPFPRTNRRPHAVSV
ncbi:unnamed protein product [Clonostachys solani]|uniref:Uncharacterized protein n=1 Tax=Clonostachys solani TaxID=160281 RepID=A0A9N9Z253_9HYPO|nr:unnamed protein product [Clonostachys solani]